MAAVRVGGWLALKSCQCHVIRVSVMSGMLSRLQWKSKATFLDAFNIHGSYTKFLWSSFISVQSKYERFCFEETQEKKENGKVIQINCVFIM
jgi:hypothetical protein